MLAYLIYKIEQLIKKHELLTKYTIWKNDLISEHPGLIPYVKMIEEIAKFFFKSTNTYLLCIWGLAFFAFISLIICAIYHWWKQK